MTDKLTNDEIRQRAIKIMNESFSDLEAVADVVSILYEIILENYTLWIDEGVYTRRQALEKFRMFADLVTQGIKDHEIGTTGVDWLPNNEIEDKE